MRRFWIKLGSFEISFLFPGDVDESSSPVSSFVLEVSSISSSVSDDNSSPPSSTSSDSGDSPLSSSVSGSESVSGSDDVVVLVSLSSEEESSSIGVVLSSSSFTTVPIASNPLNCSLVERYSLPSKSIQLFGNFLFITSHLIEMYRCS